MSTARTLILVLCILLSGKGFATGDSLKLLQLTQADGLPSNNIFSMLQDRNGYMWFTTDNGLAKYNGYTFRIFNANDGLPNEMYGMYEDEQRRLWIDYYGYDLSFIQDNIVKKVDHQFSYNNLRSFKSMACDGKIYFSYLDAGFRLLEIDVAGNTQEFTLPEKKITISQNADRKSFLVIMDGYDLHSCNPSDGGLQCTYICRLPEPVSASYGPKYAIDSGFFSYTARSRVLNHFNMYTHVLRQIHISSFGADSTEAIYIAHYTRDGVFVATNKNVYLLDKHLNFIRTTGFTHTFPNVSQVSYYLQDSSDIEWFATASDGLLMRPRIPALFQENKELDVMRSSAIVGNAPGGNTYWWDTKQKQLYALDGDLHTRFIRKFHNEDVQSVMEKDDTSVVISFTQSTHNGVFILNTRSQQLRHLADEKPYIRQTTYYRDSTSVRNDTADKYIRLKSFFNFHQYAPGVMIGTHRSWGVYKIQLTGDTMDISTYELDRYPKMIYDKARNKYWMYNKEKLVLFDPETGRYADMPTSLLKKLDISNISQVRCDDFNNVYILSDKKAIIFNTYSYGFKHISANIDLANVFMEVYDSTLYIASKFGIAYARIKGPLALGAFHISHNIRGNFYKHINGFAINARGRMVVTTDKAVYDFSVTDLKEGSQAARESKNFMRLVVGYPQQRSISRNDTVYTAQETQKIDFDFINMYGSGPRKYSYRISGGEQATWQTTEAGEVYIGDLSPGKYYTVECLVVDDIWKSDTYHFLLYRQPYWYQTSTWRIIFWITGSLAFIVLVAVIILVTRNIVARANEKKRLMTELELRALHAQINPHFIFNTLGSAQYFISKKKLDEAYIHVNKFSRLLRSYLKSSRNRYITLSEEIDMLQNYIELQKIRFEDKFDYIIDVENKIPATSVQIPSLLLQPLVENAINHGLFHLPDTRSGLLVIRFSQGSTSDELVCTIDDNGVGRRKAREIKKGSDAQYESYGTRLTEELIDIFRKYENMNIFLEYIDKSFPETGTIVKLTIRNLKYVA